MLLEKLEDYTKSYSTEDSINDILESLDYIYNNRLIDISLKEDCEKILISRNSEYGNVIWRALGFPFIYSMLFTKWVRMDTILKYNSDMSYYDSLIDLVGYSSIGLALFKKNCLSLDIFMNAYFPDISLPIIFDYFNNNIYNIFYYYQYILFPSKESNNLDMIEDSYKLNNNLLYFDDDNYLHSNYQLPPKHWPIFIVQLLYYILKNNKRRFRDE